MPDSNTARARRCESPRDPTAHPLPPSRLVTLHRTTNLVPTGCLSRMLDGHSTPRAVTGLDLEAAERGSSAGRLAPVTVRPNHTIAVRALFHRVISSP